MGTDIDYSAVAHRTIYDNITRGPGAAALIEASQAWRVVAAKLRRVQEYVDQAVRGLAAAQQGAAADAATHAAMPLVPWVSEAAVVAQSLAARISDQADLFAHTRDSMPEPRVVPDPAWNQDPMEWAADGCIDWLPGAQTDEERARVQAQQDEQRARDLMVGYQANTNDNLAARPHFTPAPQVVADLDEPRAGEPRSPGAAGRPAEGAAAGEPDQPPSPASLASHSGPASPAGPAGHVPSGPAAAGPAQPPTQPLGGPAGWAPRAAPGVRGAGGAGPRGGGFGPRPAGGSYGAVSEPTGMRQGVGGGPAPAVAPFGAPPGREGRGGLHRRPSYLVEPDTSAITGHLPPVAPPVIGEDPAEDFR